MVLALGNVGNAWAASDLEALRRTVEELQRQLQQVQQQLRAQEAATASKAEVKELKEDMQQVADAQSEWKDAESVVHLAGYGAVGYEDSDSGNDRFNEVLFAPIFHYQYKDLMMLESELEITVEEDGSTATNLEYLSLDLFLHDYAVLVGGKFLSPLGQFRQNLHPSWINKLPSSPPGFGHDQAAPVSDVGLQLRGGFPVGGARSNYAVYVSNGPVLEAETEDGEVELEAVEAEGVTSDDDGSKVVGGRFALLPIPALEVGVSFATGEASVASLDGASVSGDPAHDYDVFGADAVWYWNNLQVRGEYVKTEVSANAASVAESGGDWEAWYAQLSYQLLPTKWEGVLRYGDYDSPHTSLDQQQLAVGINYLFAPNVIAKFAYEFNDGASGAASDDDNLQLQMAYGF